MQDRSNWTFVHHTAEDDPWTPGLREIFEYRDLGVKAGTNGDYVAHVIRHNGKKTADAVQQWHVHDCDFQLVYMLNGWRPSNMKAKASARSAKATPCCKSR